MKSWLRPARRVTEARTAEALIDQVIPTGAMLGTWGRDPIDGDIGYRSASKGHREVPQWTREKARDYSVAAYRSNPMATAVIDTYVAFCVGDSGVKWQATNPKVAEVVRQFWDDPANRVGHIQEISLRSQLLIGEKLYEMLEGASSGVIRFAPVEPSLIKEVLLRNGNPLWPGKVILPGPSSEGEDQAWDIAAVNDDTMLREGKAQFWAPWRSLDTDVRGMPYLMPILDWLDNYDTVLSNLIDRTALMRHLAYSVKVEGEWSDVDAYIARRGGIHVPPSGTVEFHNDAIEWNSISAQTGAMEDTVANQAVLTNIASGTGLAKTWLAEPDGANRATSLTMAEPVRRRVGSVQNLWLYQWTEMVRFVVDRAVAAGRVPATVESSDPKTGEVTEIPASQAVIVTGPEIAAADAAITAQVLLNLATGLEKMVMSKVLTPEAAQMAGRKAWENYMGIPYSADLGKPDSNIDDITEQADKAQKTAEARLRLVSERR
jgi:hypothetical protein